MSSSPPDLLRPSLSVPGRIAAAPYSTQMGFFGAFFGGPFAAAGWAALNARRTGHWRRDAVALALLLGVGLAWTVIVHATAPGRALQDLSGQWLGSRGSVILDRFAGLMVFAAAAWLQRKEQRSAELFGLAKPNGWIAGIALIVASNAFALLVAAGLR